VSALRYITKLEGLSLAAETSSKLTSVSLAKVFAGWSWELESEEPKPELNFVENVALQ
jgi:hypothetical protein